MKRIKSAELKGKARMLAMLAGMPEYVYVSESHDPAAPEPKAPKTRKKSLRKK